MTAQPHKLLVEHVLRIFRPIISKQKMTDPIDPQTFSHLVDLASFAFEPEQAEYLCSELNKQLKAINELAAIPLDKNIQVSLHGVPYPPDISPKLREDTWVKDENQEDIISEMPQFEEGYVIVPDIPHTTLD